MTLLWKKENQPVDYTIAVDFMGQQVEKMLSHQKPELVWLLEHPSLYTLGTSGQESDILQPGEVPLFVSGRGGKVTYHGPGQRVGYVMLDLKKRGLNLRQYVQALENWLIDALACFGLQGERREGRIGVWIPSTCGRKEAKIAAIGVRIRKGITFHGFALNVHPDLTYFQKIVPCGLKNYGVISCQALGIDVSLKEIDGALQKTFLWHF